jgi:hypothetical protein
MQPPRQANFTRTTRIILWNGSSWPQGSCLTNLHGEGLGGSGLSDDEAGDLVEDADDGHEEVLHQRLVHRDPVLNLQVLHHHHNRYNTSQPPGFENIADSSLSSAFGVRPLSSSLCFSFSLWVCLSHFGVHAVSLSSPPWVCQVTAAAVAVTDGPLTVTD